MKTLLAFLFGLLILGTGCNPSNKLGRLSSSGDFTLTNNTGIIGEVIWGSLREESTNDVQFILVLPVSTELGTRSGTQHDFNYDYWTLTLKTNGHRWRIEAEGTMKAGFQSLQLRDLTAQHTWTLDLKVSRFWRVSEQGIFTRLDSVGETITETIRRTSQESFQQITALRGGH